MHEDPIDENTAALLEELAATFRTTAPPPPGPDLTMLFSHLANDKGDLPVTAASNATRSGTQTAGLPNGTRRRKMMRGLLTQMSTKMAAGALGAVLALGTLGAAGVGPVGLIGHDDEPEHTCVSLDELSTTFDEDIVVCDVSSDDEVVTDTDGELDSDHSESVEGDGDDSTETDSSDDLEEDAEATEAEEATDELPSPPTTTSEAAKIHAFDEACGNHGMYVSFFAQMGFEPPCALLVRDGGELDPEMTRQERKKAALQQRKECKAKAKSGTPCRPEDFGVTEEEEDEAPAATDTTTSTEAEDDTSSVTAEPVTETEEPREDEGGNGAKDKGDQKSKDDQKSKGDQKSKSDQRSKGQSAKGGKPKK